MDKAKEYVHEYIEHKSKVTNSNIF